MYAGSWLGCFNFSSRIGVDGIAYVGICLVYVYAYVGVYWSDVYVYVGCEYVGMFTTDALIGLIVFGVGGWYICG